MKNIRKVSCHKKAFLELDILYYFWESLKKRKAKNTQRNKGFFLNIPSHYIYVQCQNVDFCGQQPEMLASIILFSVFEQVFSCLFCFCSLWLRNLHKYLQYHITIFWKILLLISPFLWFAEKLLNCYADWSYTLIFLSIAICYLISYIDCSGYEPSFFLMFVLDIYLWYCHCNSRNRNKTHH